MARRGGAYPERVRCVRNASRRSLQGAGSRHATQCMPWTDRRMQLEQWHTCKLHALGHHLQLPPLPFHDCCKAPHSLLSTAAAPRVGDVQARVQQAAERPGHRGADHDGVLQKHIHKQSGSRGSMRVTASARRRPC